MKVGEEFNKPRPGQFAASFDFVAEEPDLAERKKKELSVAKGARSDGDVGTRSPITVRDVGKVFVNTDGKTIVEALKDINLNVPAHSIVTFLGPSGCGKTTLLRLIAGIETPSTGEIRYKGQPVKAITTDMGYVPQGKGSFPWKTLRENVEFPLLIRKVSAEERRQRAHEWIAKGGLGGFEDSFPWQLSGGMEKRGSLIRALISDPEVILMDEPFGPLDAQTRLILQDDLLRLWHERRNIIVFVTHDLVEAITLSDLIVIFSKRPGRIKHILAVPIPRPRNVFEIFHAEGFNEIYDEVRDMLRDEMVFLGSH